MVSVDTVYQRVLALANKEQRGYITPQEFNLFANQAQMDIFDQYFYDINQFGRVNGNSTDHSDMLSLLEEKVSNFRRTSILSFNNTLNGYSLATLQDFYSVGTVIYDRSVGGGVGRVEVEPINHNEQLMLESSSLTAPSLLRPIYTRENNTIKIYPLTIISGVSCKYIKYPTPVNWSYIVVKEKALYNGTNSANFELHTSEENNLVNKILALAGISIEDPTIYQTGQAQDMKSIQQEKQ